MAWYKLDEEGNIEGLFKPLTPLINYVARLNGADQYWQLSGPINVENDDRIGISFIGGVITNSYARFFASDNNSFSVDANIDGATFRVSSGVSTLDGAIINTGEPIPTVGKHDIILETANAGVLNTLGEFNGSRFNNLPLYSFFIERNGTVIHQIPLTNKAQGATQLATVGNVNATMVNYDESVWEQI